MYRAESAEIHVRTHVLVSSCRNLWRGMGYCKRPRKSFKMVNISSIARYRQYSHNAASSTLVLSGL